MHNVTNNRAPSVGWTERVELVFWLCPLACGSALLTALIMEVSDRVMSRPHVSWAIVPVLILPSVLAGVVGYLCVIRRSDPVRDLREALWQRPMLLYLSVCVFGLLTWRIWSVPGPVVVLPIVALPGLTGIGAVLAVLGDAVASHRRGEFARGQVA